MVRVAIEGAIEDRAECKRILLSTRCARRAKRIQGSDAAACVKIIGLGMDETGIQTQLERLYPNSPVLSCGKNRTAANQSFFLIHQAGY